jgi:hypothetical protein
MKIINKFLLRVPAGSFRDVARDADCGPPNLTCELMPRTSPLWFLDVSHSEIRSPRFNPKPPDALRLTPHDSSSRRYREPRIVVDQPEVLTDDG